MITLASQFGQEELGLSMTTLATVILMVQFIACLGALLFARVARHVGAKRTVLVGLAAWTGTLVFAYGRVAILSLVAFFLVGAMLLARTDVRLAVMEAGHEPHLRL